MRLTLTLRKSCKTVIALAQAAQRTEDVLTSEFHLDKDAPLSMVTLTHIAKQGNKAHDDLKKYLGTLSERRILDIETLFYFGRGDDDNIDRLRAHLKKCGYPKETLLGKRGDLIAEYIEAAYGLLGHAPL